MISLDCNRQPIQLGHVLQVKRIAHYTGICEVTVYSGIKWFEYSYSGWEGIGMTKHLYEGDTCLVLDIQPAGWMHILVENQKWWINTTPESELKFKHLGSGRPDRSAGLEIIS